MTHSRRSSGGPPDSVLHGSLGRGVLKDPAEEFPKWFRGGLPNTLEGTFSNSRSCVMPELLSKLKDFGKSIETFEISSIRMPRESLVGRPEYCGTGRKNRGFCEPRHPGEPYRGAGN